MHRLTCRHSPWAPAERWQLRRHKRHTYGERRSCVVLEQGLEGQPPLFLFWNPLQSSVQMGAIVPVLNPSPTQPEAALAWQDQPSLPNLQIVHNSLLPRSRPHPAPSQGHAFCAGNKPWLDQHAQFRGDVVADHCCQHELQ